VKLRNIHLFFLTWKERTLKPLFFISNFQDVSDPQDIEVLRSMTGICPQHNLLFDELSCYEHLYLFAGIKAVDPKLIETMVITLYTHVHHCSKVMLTKYLWDRSKSV